MVSCTDSVSGCSVASLGFRQWTIADLCGSAFGVPNRVRLGENGWKAYHYSHAAIAKQSNKDVYGLRFSKPRTGWYDDSLHAFLPYDRQWIKQKLFQHLKKLAQH
ncbi:hypothetical protein PR202_ga19792 [Eleusine coracana subsp. coracana]|uniref:Uncharacterized protein n=1 Tax=Eleusine coracana subsp. coracana TaxID=191504 RepID=A0AAV5CW95_ELECO|nr:hypothetical protein PR202_ga19792 [Eleusine coracana subsp. coracana]